MKRADAKKQAEAAGATVGSGVTGKTSILVAASGIEPFFQQLLAPAMQANPLRFSWCLFGADVAGKKISDAQVCTQILSYILTIVTFLFALPWILWAAVFFIK